jgi:Tol biopolymer transport system component
VGPTFAPPSATVDIWKLRPDGSGAVNLTGGAAANNGFPYFSPDGRQIVFRSGRDGNHELYLMNADGTGLRRLTHHQATDTMPAFSPDGKQVAFTSNRDGDHEIYLLDLGTDGKPGELRRLTHSPGFDTHPVFSPDGGWLVFSSQRGGLNDEEPLLPVFNPQPYGELYAVCLADGLVVRLTHNKWEDGTPTWVAMPP